MKVVRINVYSAIFPFYRIQHDEGLAHSAFVPESALQ
jgi:hypothetical protein